MKTETKNNFFELFHNEISKRRIYEITEEDNGRSLTYLKGGNSLTSYNKFSESGTTCLTFDTSKC